MQAHTGNGIETTCLGIVMLVLPCCMQAHTGNGIETEDGVQYLPLHRERCMQAHTGNGIETMQLS